MQDALPRFITCKNSVETLREIPGLAHLYRETRASNDLETINLPLVIQNDIWQQNLVWQK